MRRAYANPREKRRAFWLGFAAWLVINIAAFALTQVMESALGTDLDALTALQVALNLIVVIVLAVFRRYAALGAIAAVATAVWLAVFQIIFVVVSFFFGGYTWYFLGYPPHGTIAVTYVFLIAALVVGAAAAFQILRTINQAIR